MKYLLLTVSFFLTVFPPALGTSPKAIVFGDSVVSLHPSANAALRYNVTVRSNTQVHIDAELDLRVSELEMKLRGTTNQLPNGTADFVENLIVTTIDGKTMAYQGPSGGKWFLTEKASGIRLSYDIRMNHEFYDWSQYGGIDAVCYRSHDGLVATGYAFFIVPVNYLDTTVSIGFDLPCGWNAFTPWKTSAQNQFEANSISDITENCFMVGTPIQNTLKLNNLNVQLCVGSDLKDGAQLIETVLTSSFKQYMQIFGVSKTNNILIIVNKGELTDGETFKSSFDQLIKGEVNKESIVGWGDILAHETFHLWNGMNMTYQSNHQNEWVVEGFTEYMSVKSLRKGNLIADEIMFKKIENFNRRYWLGWHKISQGLSIQQAGTDKGKNYFMIYGGGSLMALVLDIEIRKATNYKKGLEDFMQIMFQKFGVTNCGYTTDDLINTLNKTAGKDLSDIVKKYAVDANLLDIEPYLKDLGLGITSFAEEMYIYVRDNKNFPNNLYKSIFL